jgi:hypothetical protein
VPLVMFKQCSEGGGVWLVWFPMWRRRFSSVFTPAASAYSSRHPLLTQPTSTSQFILETFASPTPETSFVSCRIRLVYALSLNSQPIRCAGNSYSLISNPDIPLQISVFPTAYLAIFTRRCMTALNYDLASWLSCYTKLQLQLSHLRRHALAARPGYTQWLIDE